MSVIVEIGGRVGLIRTNYKYFWAKWVTGFDPRDHCAKCLVGEWERRINPNIISPARVELDHRPGEILYICGVAEPYNWWKNFHLVVLTGSGVATRRMSNGMVVTVQGGTEIPFGPEAAKELYPRKGRKFLSCRNFQFGASKFGFVPTNGISADQYTRFS